MSFKIISNEIAGIDSIELCEIKESGTKSFLTLDSREVSLKFILKKCIVKYMPQKFDKITVILNEDCLTELTKFQNILSNEVPDLVKFIKDASLGIKLTADQKKNMKGIDIGETVSIAVQYNQIWKINGNRYASFKLLQIKTDEPINYF